MLTYHLVPAEELDLRAAEYTPSAYAREGFIHTTRRLSLVSEVGNRYYRQDPRPYLLLVIDLSRVGALWRYDAAGEEYPHIYGPLPKGAILEARPVPRAPDGAFLPFSEARQKPGG